MIVDTDRTASQILSIMNKQKLPGEVTFLPLNKLNPPNVEYPNAKNVCIHVLIVCFVMCVCVCVF